MSDAIHCHHLTKSFGDTLALDDFDLSIKKGSIVSLLGPSGCGKTTALRVIAGFERPESGEVVVGDEVVVGEGVFLPPERRRVGMVFQDYALFPHMSVARNVAYGVGTTSPQRVAEALELVGLDGMDDRMPNELSGGEQQRVALARALAPNPEVILLDEPFSNLDAPQRDRVRREVRAILTEAGATAVFVTHDQEEALSMADVVAVMSAGTVVQVGTPHDLYRTPASSWIANFLGESEFLAGTAAIGTVETEVGIFPHFTALRGPVRVMIRPEWIHPTLDNGGSAIVVDQEFYGHDQLVILELSGGLRLRSRIGANPIFNRGDRVSIGIDEVVLFPADG